MIDKNQDYGYIAVFIQYLKDIIDMLVKLFSGVSKEEETPAEGENVEAG